MLDEKIKKLVKSGAIEMGHARVLITLEKSNQINLANEIISKGLSVREAEKLVSLKKPIKKSKNTFYIEGLKKTILITNLFFSKLASFLDDNLTFVSNNISFNLIIFLTYFLSHQAHSTFYNSNI